MVGRKSLSYWPSVLDLFLVARLVVSDQSYGNEIDTAVIQHRLEQLQGEINQLKAMLSQQQVEQERTRQELETYRQKVQAQETLRAAEQDRLHIGGYGEIKGKFRQGSDADFGDIHRLVLEIGYDFSDWVRFFSEWEVEHALVSDTADGSTGGYLMIEQAYFDFLLSDMFNVRAGRILTPMGIINKRHEPDTFFGVDRPSVERYIIPTTWPSDGVGLFGNLGSHLAYEMYVVGGLDGSKFNAVNGIRSGRQRERPGLNDPAVTGRLDYFPQMSPGQDLRLGVSGYYGGLNNGNRGRNPGISGKIRMLSADFEYSIDKWDFRGVIVHTDISNARQIGNGAASEMFGWYLEGGYHFWPDSFKVGKLADSDAVAFVRYDHFDTQHKMPSGIAADPAGDRNTWTFGMNFDLTSNVVFKTDYQIQKDRAGNKENWLNFGLGFSF